MKNKQPLHKLFFNEPRVSLLDTVMKRIDKEKIKKAKQRFIFFMTSSVFSFFAFISAARYVIDQFTISEFSQYFSLIFSDSGYVISYWKQFSLVLTESLPIMSLAILLSITFIMLYSFRNLLKNFTIAPLQTI